MHTTGRAKAALALLLLFVAGGWMWTAHAGPGADMTRDAQRFLQSLSGDQRAQATMPFDGSDRVAWHFIPKPDRKGLQIRDMSQEQRKAAFALLSSALSEVGYDKSRQIMELESILHALEKNRPNGNIRDALRYYFTLFGEPELDTRWGLSVEGHHLSLNFVVNAGRVVAHTPAFLGANPAEVKSDVGVGPGKGTRTLAKEEDLAFRLLHAFNETQRQTVMIADKAPREMRAAGEAHPPSTTPEGLPAGKMNEQQVETLWALIEAYLENMPASIAKARRSEIKNADFDRVHFAWAGASRPGIGHYYRVQGPTFLIEFVNTQPDAQGNPANHIHSIWRNMAGDFGISR